LIAAVAEAERPACLDGLIPDQTPEGTFRSSAELGRDTDIDDELKDVLEVLGEGSPMRNRKREICTSGSAKVRVLPSAGITQLQRSYDPVRPMTS
jgi:hypothetical protein